MTAADRTAPQRRTGTASRSRTASGYRAGRMDDAATSPRRARVPATPVRSRRSGRAWVPVVALGLAAAAGASACSDVAGGNDDETDRAVDIYVAVLRSVVEPVKPDVEHPPVFVEHEDMDEDIALDVQVGVVNELEDEYDVRFIDSREEALPSDEPDAPVADDGVLVGLGPIGTGDPVTVLAHRYWGEGREESFAVDVHKSGDEWDAATPREVAPPTTVATDG
jgi:hypothetical protein